MEEVCSGVAEAERVTPTPSADRDEGDMIGEWKKDEASDSSVAAGEAATTAPRLGARLLGRLGLDLPRWVRGVLLLADPGMTPPISGTVSSSKFGVVLRPPPFKWLWLNSVGVRLLLVEAEASRRSGVAVLFTA